MAAQMAWLFEREREMIPGSGFVIKDDFIRSSGMVGVSMVTSAWFRLSGMFDS
tara:strand:+ start:648 stop:806 length:159 start_codon:yes stop_codon:yes gene_type:complete